MRAKLPDGRMGDLAKCRSPKCGAVVVFATNPKTGKTPPYDLDGTPHFATCPDAESFRGKAKKTMGEKT
jgi:hypothetical protein